MSSAKLRRSFPTLKQLQQSIKTELIEIEKSTQQSINEANAKKLKSYYNYLKHSQPTKIKEINEKIKALENETKQLGNELKDTTTYNDIIDRQLSNEHQILNNLQNVQIFLKNQREYFNLLLRYNPGLSMDKGENVSKSANRVGLQVPQ
ncbi:unnamed protein product [Candida verbasci]|uniref:Uncharacterized protein n=1 Tax=Candida verbasci TaxID=1227364 RepID=A0A9W4X933_9ASCO|nr:unnamed protein product [Candida verbasci]